MRFSFGLASCLLPVAALGLSGCGQPGATAPAASAPATAITTASSPVAASTSAASPTPATPAPSPTATSSAPSGATTGVISGRLTYPSSSIPTLKIYAMRSDQGSDHPAYWWIHLNGGGVTSYTMSDIPPGTYNVFAYVDGDESRAGGYTQMVPCGLTAACNDHTLLPVVVKAGQVTSGVDVSDWYGSASAFPPRPTYYG